MIAFLRGRVFEKQPNKVIVDVGGVGYDVAIPLSTYYAIGDAGAELAVRVHTHVREDQLALFGFATELELIVFERLISISGIGPKLALAVLSGIEPNELVTALQEHDVGRLTRIPGVGKKTAERIVLELGDRLPKALAAVATGAPPPAPADELRDDLTSTLINLGYHRQSIDKTLERLLRDQTEPDFQDVLRAALKELSRG